MNQIFLASASPRRKALLTQIGIPFTVMTSAVEESLFLEEKRNTSPEKWVTFLSRKKAEDVAEKVPSSSIIIGADTVVVYNHEILEKPKNEADAFQMLWKLQQNTHKVYTGVTVIVKERDTVIKKSFYDSATVSMRPLTENEINAYIKTGEPMDKAGAYGIQEKGTLLVASITGDYTTIVGLPLTKLYMVLKEMGINSMDFWQPENHK